MPLTRFLCLALLFALLLSGCKSKSVPQPASPAATTASGEAASPWKLDLTVSPDHPRMVQPVTFAVHITDGGGKAVDNAQVTGSLTMKTMDMGKTDVKLEARGNGNYQGTVKSVDMSGPWDLTVDASQGGFHALKKFEIVIYE